MNAIVEAPSPIMALITTAIDKGMDVASLTGLFNLQERYEKQEAARVWAEQVRLFQSLAPTIKQSQGVRNRDGDLMYRFADYDDDLLAIVQPLLTECGITVTFNFRYEDKLIFTTCHVRVGTHVEDTEVPLGIPQIPNANDTQRAGGCLQYGKRYSLIAALNLRVSGQDNDAAGMTDYIDQDQWKQLQDLINDCHMVGRPVNMPAFLKLLDVDDLRKMVKAQVPEAVRLLNAKKEGKGGTR